MSQGPPRRGEDPEGEKLSGTVLGNIARSLTRIESALGGLSTTFAFAGAGVLVLGVILLLFLSDLRLYSYITLGIGGGLVATSVVISFGTVSRAVKGRRGRYSTNTVVMIAAFLGIAAFANFLAFENSARMDVTAAKKFSLAQRTLDLLKNLDEPVEAKAFFGPATSPEEETVQREIRDVLDEFEVHSQKFSYEFVDPDAKPGIARDYGITQYGTIAVDSKNSKKIHLFAPTVSLGREGALQVAVQQDFVTALLIVTGKEQKIVYFLTGHGERDVFNREPSTEGFGFAATGTEDENYAVFTLNLTLPEGKEQLELDRCQLPPPAAGAEPEPCQPKVNMVIVAGPRDPLPDNEAQILNDYLKSGGNMLFLVEPDTHQSFRNFLARWGTLVGEGRIVDLQRSLPENTEITVVTREQYINTIPEPLNSLLGIRGFTSLLDTTYYPGVTSLAPAGEGVLFFPSEVPEDEDQEDQRIPTVFGTALAVTSAASWLINDPGRTDPQPGDQIGPLFPAIAVRAIAPLDEELPADLAGLTPASIVVFGDSDFASNRYFHSFGNSDFFLNAVNWLVGDIPLAGIRARSADVRVLETTRNQYDIIRFTSWLMLPALMAALGGFVWWRRR